METQKLSFGGKSQQIRAAGLGGYRSSGCIM